MKVNIALSTIESRSTPGEGHSSVQEGKTQRTLGCACMLDDKGTA